jgi:hypothetical protein
LDDGFRIEEQKSAGITAIAGCGPEADFPKLAELLPFQIVAKHR